MERVADVKRRAHTLIQHGRWDEAIRAYERLAEGSEPDPYLQVLIGDVHLKRGTIVQAVEAYQRAVDGYREAGLHKNAIALCKKILRLNHDRGTVLVTLAELNALDGLAGEAAVCYMSAADEAVAAGDEHLAGQRLAAGVSVAPTHAECSRKLVDLRKRGGQNAAAATELVRFAQALHMAGLTASSEQHLAEARALDPAVDVPPFDALPSAGEPLELPHFSLDPTQHAMSPGESNGGHPLEGLEATHLKTPAETVSIAEALAATAPAPAEAAKPESPRDLAEAVPDLHSVSSVVVRDDPNQGIPLVDLSDILKEFKQSLDTQLSANDSKAHFDMAMAYMEMDLWGDAVAEFAAASRDAEMRPMCYEMLGQCYLKQGQPEDAVRFLELGMACDGLEEEAKLSMRYYLGLALAELGRDEEACLRLEEVTGARPDFLDARSRLESLRLRRAS